MNTGIKINTATPVEAAVASAESLDMLLRTIAETRTPECIAIRALDMLGQAMRPGNVSVSNVCVGDTHNQSVNPPTAE